MKEIVQNIKKLAIKNKNIDRLVFFCLIAFGVINRIVFFFFGLRKVKKKKIVFCNMKGLRYGDNPKYITDEIIALRGDLELVWLINKNVEVDIPSYIRRSDYSYFNRIKELASASVWVDSNLKDYGIKKRKDQLYIQTWHGSYGLKKVALDIHNIPKVDEVLYPFNANITDAMVSNSKRTTEIYRTAFAFRNRILEVGSPRNDVFFGDKKYSITSEVKKYFDIPFEDHIVLYAPTFRGNYKVDFFNIDFSKVCKVLHEIYGNNWYVLIRMHPQNLKEAKKLSYNKYILNASEYSIMQNLLVAADFLITDYSSCMFDFITRSKPCFIYAPDLDEYEHDRGNYFSMKELPFPLAHTNEELIKNIEEFDENDYSQRVIELHNKVGLCETGNASKIVADYIIKFIETGEK